VTKADFSQGSFRWLTVTGPDDPDGTELQLALTDSTATAYQQARLAQGAPTVMFNCDDVRAECARCEARGAELTMRPTDVTGSTIATLKDTCGNLVQLVQLKG